MKKVLNYVVITFALVLTVVVGCSQSDNNAATPTGYLAPGTYDLKMTVDGWERTYRVHIPSGGTDTSPAPLVIALHGGYGTGIVMEQLTGFTTLADKENFIVAYPDAISGFNPVTDRHWTDGRTSITAAQQGVTDVNFIGALVDEFAKMTNINSKKVYICGFSNGAMMSHRLALELSTKIAAIGAVSGTPVEDIAGTVPSESVGIMHFHGTNDPLVPYNGGNLVSPVKGRVLAVEDTILLWRNYDQTGIEVPVEIINTNPLNGTIVEHYAYKGGINGTEVHLYKIIGGGHVWPSAGSDVDTSTVMWNFFQTQHKP